MHVTGNYACLEKKTSSLGLKLSPLMIISSCQIIIYWKASFYPISNGRKNLASME